MSEQAEQLNEVDRLALQVQCEETITLIRMYEYFLRRNRLAPSTNGVELYLIVAEELAKRGTTDKHFAMLEQPEEARARHDRHSRVLEANGPPPRGLSPL